MTPHERELIVGVADELRTADRSAVDRSAEQLIRTEVAAQPNAAYLLTQRVIVQQLALRQAQQRLDELEARVRSAGGTAPGGSFLGGAGGAESPGPQGGGYAPQGGPGPAPAGGGVGNFLKTAAAAAAGTIGGQLIYDGVRHLAADHWGAPGGVDLSGGHESGGFTSSGLGGSRSGDGDHLDLTSDAGKDWGGGGDLGTDLTGGTEDVEAADEDEDEDDPDGTADLDDDADAPDDGGGGSW